MSAIEEVKQKTDIVEIIGQYTTLKKAGKNLTALCPFHSEKHPSFFVYPEQQSWHCFGACNTGGDVLSFIMKKESMDFGEALRLLADRAGVVRWMVRVGDRLVWTDDPGQLKEKSPDATPKSVTFIPAKVTDNRILLEKDPGYIANLQALPP